MTTPTKDTLLALFKRRELDDLANDLEKGKTTFEEMMARTQPQWKEIAGIANGIDIYNHLRPSPQSSRSGSETDLSVAAPRQKRQKTGWTTTSIVPLNYDPSSALFELDSAYLANSGLPASQKLVLYCRPTFHQQFKFLQESVIDNARLGWILGPPGTGKSTTALAFASTLDSNEWVVTWIHLSRVKPPVCVRYESGIKKTRVIRDQSLDELEEILWEVAEGRKHVVFIDGYTLNGDKHIDIQKVCYCWRDEDRVNHRLVVICSMSSRGKTKLEEDMMDNVEEFFVYSWGLDEYLAAVQHEAFFNNVKHNLDSSDDLRLSSDEPPETEPSRIELIKSKFYFAGGCSRYMFLFKTATVIKYLQKSVAAVIDIMPYIKGTIGDESNAVINRLFSHYFKQDDSTNDRSICIVSEWTASQLAMKGGPDLVKNLAVVTRHEHNAAMNGWLFEMWFFALLRCCGVTLYDDHGNEQGRWESSIVRTFTDIPTLPDDGGVWLKPIKWNQGGYDAIFIDKTSGRVRFLQVTRGDSHSFKIGYFYKFLQMLRDSPSSFQISTIEIVFLVLKGKIANFKISEVSGQGLLADFGWQKGKETDNAHVVGITDWD